MAEDKLVFPVEFDIDSGADQAIAGWDSAQKKIQSEIDKDKLEVKITLDKDTSEVSSKWKSIKGGMEQALQGDPLTVRLAMDDNAVGQIDSSINGISNSMKLLVAEWNKMPSSDKFLDDGSFTEKAKAIIESFTTMTASAQVYGKTLKQIASEAVKEFDTQEKAEIKAIQTRQDAWDKYYAAARKYSVSSLTTESTASADDRAYYAELERLAAEKAKQDEADIKMAQKRETAWEKFYNTQRKLAVESLTTESTASADDRAYYAELEQLSQKRITQLNKENQAKQKNYNTTKQSGLAIKKILDSEAKSIDDINAKLSIQKKRLQSSDLNGKKFEKIAAEVKKLNLALSEAQTKLQTATGQVGVSNASVKNLQAAETSTRNMASYTNVLIQRWITYNALSSTINFAKNIRDTTAEFELQRVSLGALIQDAEKADQIFEQIKASAVESPFEIKDLVTYTKQLAAYGFETEELFDTMNSLADVSAGLGVSFDRIVLAYGQVAAKGHLAGTELKQFTEAGIPLVALLSEKFSELQGEVVSTAEVYDMISNKEISFGDVASVFDDMTSAGGRFYDMQKVQAETLSGIFSNLKDSISIAYDEMGRDNRGLMVDAIKLVKSLWENWETVYTVLLSVGTALSVYTIGMKNASIASKALTTFEASRLAITKAQVIATPKLVAAMVGETAAKKLSTTITKLHTAAMVKQATATGILTKAFWSLTASILANPYLIATAAIVGLGVGIYNMFKNAETAEDRMSKLAKSTQQFADTQKKVQPLIDEFDRLSAKADKSEAELQKLKVITKELNELFPTAKGVAKDLGDEVGSLASEYARLYEAQLNSRRLVVEADIEATTKDLAAAQSKLEQLNTTLQKGTKTVESGGTYLFPKYEDVDLTIDELRQLQNESETLVGKIDSMNKKIEYSRGVLAGFNGSAGDTTDAFQGWKKVLKDAVGEYEKFNGENASISLYTDKSIESFNNFGEAINDVVSKYKSAKASIETYNNALKNSTLTEEERQQITNVTNRLVLENDLRLAIIKRYNAEELLGSGSTTKNPRIAELQSEVTLVEAVYKKYKEYLAYMTEAEARAEILANYGEALSSVKIDGFDDAMEIDFSDEGLKKFYAKVKAEYGSLEEYIKARAIQVKMGDVDFTSLKTSITKELAKLSTQIEQQQVANDFFTKMLGITGDSNLAMSMTMSVYGDVANSVGEEMAESMAEKTKAQLKTAFKGISIDDYFDTDGNIDVSGLYKQLDQLPEVQRKLAEKMLEQISTSRAKEFYELEKSLSQFKSYEERRTEIQRQGQQQREEISKTGLGSEYVTSRTNASYKQELDALTALEVEVFKSSDTYTKIFEDLERTSTSSIKAMLGKLAEFMEQNKSAMSPTDVKALQNAYDDLYNELLDRNPFAILSMEAKSSEQSVRDAKKALQEALDAVKEDTFSTQYENLAEAEFNLSFAEQSYENAKGTDREAEAALELLTAKQDLIKAQEEYNELTGQDEVIKAEQAYNEALNARVEKGEAIISLMSKITSYSTDILEIATSYASLFNMSDEAQQMFDTIISGISSTIEGLTEVGTGVGQIMTGDIFGGVVSIVKGIPSIISGITDIFYAGRVKRANEEIERQAQIIEDLEYAYGRLEKAMENSIGSDYSKNLAEQRQSLEEMADAAEKQADAERSKGKKEDKTATAEYEKQAQEYRDQAADLEGLSAELIGTSKELSQQFAQTFLEAYKSFADTSDAMKAKFKEMIDDMVANSIIGAIIQKNIIDPMLEEIDKMEGQDIDNASKWAQILDTAYANIDKTVPVLEAIAEKYDIARGDSSGLEGIAKNISTASEEAVLGLSAGVATQNYYMATISAQVTEIRALMDGSATTSDDTLILLQNTYLAELPNIALNTANTVAECRNVVAQLAQTNATLDVMGVKVGAMQESLDSVIQVQAITPTKMLHVKSHS